MDQDESLQYLAEDIGRYLASHSEGDLERVEMDMALYMMGWHPGVAILVWDFVNRHPELFGMEARSV